MVRKAVLTALVYGYTVCVMLGLGSSIKIDVWAEMKKSPRAVACGLASQFGIMPLLAFVLSLALGLGEMEAMSLLLLGMSPGGVTSTLFTYMVDANVTVSVVMTTLSTACALFMMPLLLFVYARPPLVRNKAQVSYAAIVVTLLIATIPALAGWRLRKKFEQCADFVERWVTRLGFALVLAAIASVLAWPSSQGHAGVTAKAFVAMFAMLPSGFALGYGAAWLTGLDKPLARTVSMETGIQQVGIAGAIAVNSFEGAPRDKAVTVTLVFGMLTFGAGLLYAAGLRSMDRAAAKFKNIPKDLEATVVG